MWITFCEKRHFLIDRTVFQNTQKSCILFVEDLIDKSSIELQVAYLIRGDFFV